jgi:hypothetical protein
MADTIKDMVPKCRVQRADMQGRLDPYDELRSQLDTAFHDALRKATLWKSWYIVIRALMITLSVLTSADAVSAVSALGNFHPVLGIGVALLTAFDGWLKPDVKYRVAYSANDAYTRLTRKLSRVPTPPSPEDPSYLAALGQISEEFDSVNEKYTAGLI